MPNKFLKNVTRNSWIQTYLSFPLIAFIIIITVDAQIVSYFVQWEPFEVGSWFPLAWNK